MISFIVPGKPAPQGSMVAAISKTTGRVFMKSGNEKALRAWRRDVAASAIRVGAELIEGPVRVDVAFTLQRPKSHYRTGKNARLLRDSAPALPTTKPDVDKLLRAVLDALTGIAFVDDAQVTQTVATKSYALRGEIPETYIQVRSASAHKVRSEREEIA